MDIKELLDEDSLDPKKYFNEKDYHTIIVNREGFSRRENDIADLLGTLLAPDTTRQESEELFSRLKELNASEMLVNAIGKLEDHAMKAKLISACWESGLDFTPHFLFFTELALSADFDVAMEALTVIENIDGELTEGTLAQAMQMAAGDASPHPSITEDLVKAIRARIS